MQTTAVQEEQNKPPREGPSPPGRLAITAPQFDETEIENLRTCLASKWVTQGPFTKSFEDLFAQRHQVRHARATTSCTAALHLAALALGLQPGDEVIVPAFTWVTSAHCAEYVGARAVFADIDAATFNLDPAALAAAITPRSRAVVVVHLFGLAAQLNEILDVARRHDLRVIEDAACAVGTQYAGRPVGGFGDLGCFSFHPRKVITTGEGGMVTTNADELEGRISSLRNHGTQGFSSPVNGSPRPYTMGEYPNLGFNLRLSDIQAAVGVAQMSKLDGLLAERAGRAARYTEALHGWSDIATPMAPGPSGHSYQSYVIRVLEGGVSRRNAIMDHLDHQGIQTRPGTHAVHRLSYYREKYGLRPEDFPRAAKAEDSTITLPIFPGMTDREQDRVVDALRQALELRTHRPPAPHVLPTHRGK